MTRKKLPERWQTSEKAIRAVQVAFDVEEKVLEAIRSEACRNNRTASDQIRSIVGLPVSQRVKRPRLTLSLSAEDYQFLAKRYDLAAEDRLEIKEKLTSELLSFAARKNKHE